MLPDNKRLQILDIGSGPNGGTALDVFAPILEQGYEYDLVKMDIVPDNNPDIVHDIRNPLPPELHGRFDLILASHVFEHVERHVALPAFRNMASALAKNGELWIVVPSLEWCAEQILNNKVTAAVWLCLYGGGEPNQPSYWYHNMGYTLTTLRQVFTICGLVVRKAYQVPFTLPFMQVGSDEKREYVALQNVVIGVKVDDPVDIVG